MSAFKSQIQKKTTIGCDIIVVVQRNCSIIRMFKGPNTVCHFKPGVLDLYYLYSVCELVFAMMNKVHFLRDMAAKCSQHLK